MLSLAMKLITLNVVILNVGMQSVMAPLKLCFYADMNV